MFYYKNKEQEREMENFEHRGCHIEFPSEHKEDFLGRLTCVLFHFWASFVRKSLVLNRLHLEAYFELKPLAYLPHEFFQAAFSPSDIVRW